MEFRNRREALYFEWMYELVCDDNAEYHKLFKHLFEVPFGFTIAMDQNRAVDGTDLRKHYGFEHGLSAEEIEVYLDYRPCSVLEMLVALARRCEFQIMADEEQGDRTSLWFWIMITNLDISKFTDDCYDEKLVDQALYKFMNREFNPDGSNGGIFVIPNCNRDLRTIDFWYQMNWYMASYLKEEESY